MYAITETLVPAAAARAFVITSRPIFLFSTNRARGIETLLTRAWTIVLDRRSDENLEARCKEERALESWKFFDVYG